MLSIFNDFYNYLNDRFQGQIPNLIYFAIGCAIGLIIFILLFLIIYIISKSKSRIKKLINNKNAIVDSSYKEVISKNVSIYKDIYANKPIKERVSGLGQITLNMLDSISSIYYPNSNDSIFEISTEQLVDFLSFFVYRVNGIIDHLLEERLSVVNVLTKRSLKDKRISSVFEMIDKNKIEEGKEKKGLFNKIKKHSLNIGKKIAIKYGGKIINSEFEDIIQILGEDINCLYSKQDMNTRK
ncbi:MAG: hypothetical protein SOU19_04230 [Candidatus Caccosoma sp.]|nr:hypothetical protein [Candidatus Caccosoma sp.]